MALKHINTSRDPNAYKVCSCRGLFYQCYDERFHRSMKGIIEGQIQQRVRWGREWGDSPETTSITSIRDGGNYYVRISVILAKH